MRKTILILFTAIGIGLYFSCSNSSNGSGGTTPTPTSSTNDSTIILSIDGQPEIKYYVPFVGATKQADGKYAINTVASATPKTTVDGTLTLIIKSFTNAGGVFELKDKALMLLTTPKLPLGGASNCKTNAQGSITITKVIEQKDKMVKGSYPGSISGNFTATLCELGDGKTHTITGTFENLRTVFIDPAFLDGTGSITDANKDIKISLNNGTEATYPKVLANVTYVKTIGLSFGIFVNKPGTNDKIMEITMSTPVTTSSSIKGTHLITKEIDPDVKHVVGEYKVEADKNDYQSYECGPVEGSIIITDEFRQSAGTPGFFEGYISGTYSFKVCDGDGKSATVKGSFTKLYTTFAGDF